MRVPTCPHCGATDFLVVETIVHEASPDTEPNKVYASSIWANEIDDIQCRGCAESLGADWCEVEWAT